MIFFPILSLFALTASAKVVTYNWSLGWISAAPDGFNRPVIAINGQFPLPTINVTLGDQLVINVVNNLGNSSATLHFHGIYQTGGNAMDGPSMVTQCGITPGQNLTYSFMINQPGTYFYHSHFEGQYPDGLRGALIVHDPNPPFVYDFETVLTLSDWYHDQMADLTNYYLNNTLNSAGPEPIPYSALINDAQEVKLNVQPGKTYFLRVINFSAFSQMYLKFDQHQMQIVEVDGIYTQSRMVDTLYVAVGQRYGILLTTKTVATTNYAALAKLDETMYDSYGTASYTAQVAGNVNAYLIYSPIAALPTPLTPSLTTLASQIIDDFTLIPYDQQPLLTNPTQTFVLELDFFVQNGQNRAGFNNVTWLPQKVPSLFTALTTGADALKNHTYGINANAMVLNYNEIIEVVINNNDNGGHPIHIHGHTPQLVARAAGTYSPPPPHFHKFHPLPFPNPGTWMPAANTLGYTGNQTRMPSMPMRRDTWMLAPKGYTVIRFKADNPGVWFFHCHMDWHNIAGLAATFIEAPLQLQQTQSVPKAWNDTCANQGMKVSGNAGGSASAADLSGANTVPAPLGTWVGAAPQ